MHVIARLWPVRPPWHAPIRHLTLSGPAIRVRVRVIFTTAAVRSAILATAGLLVVLTHHFVDAVGSSRHVLP